MATCGVAAPTFAVAGGGIIGGISAGTSTTAASVATMAMIVASAATVTAVASTVAEKAVEKTTKRNNSVYVLKDNTGTVQYVGRTTDVAKRTKAHASNPVRAALKLEVIQPNLNYIQARAVEQAAMAYYHTINTMNKMNNQINGISPLNPKLGIIKKQLLECWDIRGIKYRMKFFTGLGIKEMIIWELGEQSYMKMI